MAQGNDAGNAATLVLPYGGGLGENSSAAGRDALLSHGYDKDAYPWVREKCPLISSLLWCVPSYTNLRQSASGVPCLWL